MSESINQSPAFIVGGRARVNALGNPYHGQVCRILSLNVKTPDNLPAARIGISGGIERKIPLTNLEPFTPPALQPVTPAPKPQYIPTLPVWASAGMVMCQGCDLEPGDTVYFSAKANPRVLGYRVSVDEWKGVAVSGSHRVPTSIYITPSRWYVVKHRAVSK